MVREKDDSRRETRDASQGKVLQIPTDQDRRKIPCISPPPPPFSSFFSPALARQRRGLQWKRR